MTNLEPRTLICSNIGYFSNSIKLKLVKLSLRIKQGEQFDD